jgi:hypothetical protein
MLTSNLLNSIAAAGPNPTPEAVGTNLASYLKLETNRTSLAKATAAPIRFRKTTPGLVHADVAEVAAELVNRQLHEGLGEEGEELTLQLAVGIADLLDHYAVYHEKINAVPLDLDAVAEMLGETIWNSTSTNIRNQLFDRMKKERSILNFQLDAERDSLSKLLEQIDKSSPVTLEKFERRRLENRRVPKRTIEKKLREMREAGLLG